MKHTPQSKKDSAIPGIPECRQECLYEFIYNKISLGMVILDSETKSVTFKNKYFVNLAKKQEKPIIRKMLQLINNKEVPNLDAKDIIVNVDSLSYDIGISGYQIGKSNFLFFVKDITTKKISQEQKKMNKFYFDFSKALGTITHEVGNPLASIGTTLQIIMAHMDKWDSDKKKDYLQKTINEISRVTEFLKKIRHFSWEEDLDLESVNLKKIVQKVIDSNELVLDSKNISVSFDIDPAIQVKIDENAFFQVILNLVNNSINAMKKTPKGKLSFTSEEYNQDFIKLIYTNNGKALKEEELDKLFTLFYSTNEKGRGMGLAICLKLMASMGGTIKAVLPKNKIGAEFHLYLPVNDHINTIPE